MAKHIVQFISLVAIVLSAIWFYTEGGFEPLITTLAGIAGMVSSRFIPSGDNGKNKTERALPGTDTFEEPEPFESEFWPEEGRPVFSATTNHLTLYVRPSHKAPIAREVEVPLYSEIKFNAFRYRTIRPGRVVAKAEGVLRGRNLGKISYLSRETYYDSYSEHLEFPYSEGDSFEYLQYRAEGTGFIRWAGDVIDVESCPWLGRDHALALTCDPIAESWLQVIDESGQPIGWLLADGVNRIVDRRF